MPQTKKPTYHTAARGCEVWCLHCEQVGQCRVSKRGYAFCSYCNASEHDLRHWKGLYEVGKVYQFCSDEFMEGTQHSDSFEPPFLLVT